MIGIQGIGGPHLMLIFQIEMNVYVQMSFGNFVFIAPNVKTAVYTLLHL